MSTKTKSKTAHNRIVYTIIYIILIFCAVLCVFPFFWMITTSFKSTAEAYSFPPTILPKRWLFSNFVNGLQAADFGRFTMNTVLLVIVNTVATVLSSAFVAYGFAKRLTIKSQA
jgi:multiple sugar transport system permease protein